MTTPENLYGIEPLGDSVLVSPLNPPEGPKIQVLESGEILELPSLSTLERGVVVAIGALDIPPGVVPGATILFRSEAGDLIRGSELLLLAIEDVSAIVKNPPSNSPNP